MNRLLLAFGLVCLLQGLSAEPRPEFALNGTVPASVRITAVKTDANVTATAIKALTVTNVTSGFAGLVGTKTQIEKVITQFDTKAQSILAAYDTLLAANDGNVATQFNAFVTTINATITYIATDASNVTAELGVFNYTGISDELTDAFERILTGLTDLRAKTVTVQTGIQAAVNSASSATISADILRQFVPLRTMYDLLRAASNLRAYLPLVQYILTTTIENIAEADSYLMNLKSLLSTGVSSEASKYGVDIEKVTSEIEAQLAGDFAAEASNANTTYFNVNQLSNINRATNHSDLMSTLSTLNNLFTTTTLAGKTATLGSAFDKINTSLTTLVSQLQNSTDVLTNPLVKELVDTLMGNDEYGRYCYHKYKDLVQGLFGQSFDSAWQCVDKEYERLEYLKVTLGFIVDILAFDYEDVSVQADVCNSLTTDDNLNSCVLALTKYYKDLFAATADKVTQVFQFATDEAAASENRILICFQLVNIEGSVTAVEEISADLTTCSISGPRGTD